MGKKFSELKAGDSVWIWWLNKLYEYPFDCTYPANGNMEYKPGDALYLRIKGGGIYYFDDTCLNSETFIYGTDGWHEYKIFGTSKEAVKNLLQEVLTEYIKKVEADKQKWLSEFDK